MYHKYSKYIELQYHSIEKIYDSILKWYTGITKIWYITEPYSY